MVKFPFFENFSLSFLDSLLSYLTEAFIDQKLLYSNLIGQNLFCSNLTGQKYIENKSYLLKSIEKQVTLVEIGIIRILCLISSKRQLTGKKFEKVLSFGAINWFSLAFCLILVLLCLPSFREGSPSTAYCTTISAEAWL